MATDIVKHDVQDLLDGWMEAERNGNLTMDQILLAWQDVNAQVFSFQVLGELARRSRIAESEEECVNVFMVACNVSNVGKSVYLGEVGDALIELCDTIMVSSIRSQKIIEKSKQKPNEQVYFLLDRSASLLKIGRSCYVSQRKRALESQGGRSLEILGSFVAKSAQCETKIHRQFKHLRQEGEWFDYQPELQQFVEKLFANVG